MASSYLNKIEIKKNDNWGHESKNLKHIIKKLLPEGF